MRRAWSVKTVLFALAILAVGTGCVTSTLTQTAPEQGQVSRSGNRVVANIKAVNSGVFLFYFIPLWSGEHHQPNRMQYELFENQVEPKFIRRMFDRRCALLKGDAVEDVAITTAAAGWLTLWIVCKREVRGSAVVTAR